MLWVALTGVLTVIIFVVIIVEYYSKTGKHRFTLKLRKGKGFIRAQSH